jgi:hypothetical protein
MGGSLMAYGTANVDVVQSSTAGVPPQFNDGNGTQTGTLCRAWVNFNGVTTATIRASFNVSSVTRNGTGDYTVNFTNAMPDGNYVASLTGKIADTGSSDGRWTVSPGTTAVQTGSFRLYVTNAANSVVLDAFTNNVAVFR